MSSVYPDELLGQPAATVDTATLPLGYQSDVMNSDSQLQQPTYEDSSVIQTEYASKGPYNATVPTAVDSAACGSVIGSNKPDVQDYNGVSPYAPAAAAVTTYNDVSFEQSDVPYPPQSSQSGYSHSPALCYGLMNTEEQLLDARGSSLASHVSSSLSTNLAESGLPATDGATATLHCSSETDRKVLYPLPSSEQPSRASVLSLAQQLDAYWAQRHRTPSAALQHDRELTAATRRPTAPPPAPPSSLAATDPPYFDQQSPSDYDDQLMTQTLPRAASTRSLQVPPPRPPPRTTTPYDASTTLLGRSLPPEPPSQLADIQTTFDRMSSYQSMQMTTFQTQRSLKDHHGVGGLSGSVQSLPGSDVTATATISRAARAAAPQPPRRGSSMSPRLQTKSLRSYGGGRARSASLRANNNDSDEDLLQRLTGSGTSATLETSSVRQTARQATVSGSGGGQKPVAQIRPHAIRSPSASSITRQRIGDDDDVSKCSAVARTDFQQQQTPDVIQPVTVDSASSNMMTTGVSRFGTLRSRIKDYVSAAAAVGTNRKQQFISSTSSSSFGDWTLPRGRSPGGVTRRSSSSATSWEPDQSDYAASSRAGSTSFDDSGTATGWSSTYFGVFPAGPRPFIPPAHTRASQVTLPQNIVASATDSSATTSAADVTSSITSRINTFLTFLGGSRRPAADIPPGSSSVTVDNTATERASGNVATETKTRAVVDPIISSTLGRSSRSMSSPPVRSASTSEMLARAAAAAAAAARDARGRQPLRFVREQRTTMSTFRNSGSLNVSVARSSSFTPHTAPAAESAASADASQLSDGRRPSKSGVSTACSSCAGQPPAALSPRYAHQSAPSTPLDWSDESGTHSQTMTSSLPVDTRASHSDQTADRANTAPQTDAENVADDSSTTHTCSLTSRDTSRDTCNSSTVTLSVFRQVDVEVERLIELLQNAAVTAGPPSTGWDGEGRAARVEAARESLLALTRQFVDDSQRLVSGATRSVDALVAGVEPSIVTLTRLVGECQTMASLLTSPSQGVMLVGRVRDLAQAYRSTVSAARSAVGRPFNSIEMKSLMRQATSLAAILSALIKMLNRTDIIC